MIKSVSGPQGWQLMCLLQSANFQIPNSRKIVLQIELNSKNIRRNNKMNKESLTNILVSVITLYSSLLSGADIKIDVIRPFSLFTNITTCAELRIFVSVCIEFDVPYCEAGECWALHLSYISRGGSRIWLRGVPNFFRQFLLTPCSRVVQTK